MLPGRVPILRQIPLLFWQRSPGKDGKVPSYLEQEVMSWSKEKIILKMYDLFVVSAKRKDVHIDLITSSPKGYKEIQFSNRIKLYCLDVGKKSLHYWKRAI